MQRPCLWSGLATQLSGFLGKVVDFDGQHVRQQREASRAESNILRLSLTTEAAHRIKYFHPTALKVAEDEQEAESHDVDEQEDVTGRPMTHIRSLTHKMTTRPSATVQNGIDELLQKLFVKHGGEAAGSNMFFSEGDEDTAGNQADDSSPTISQADCRIRKKNSRRNVKHATHSGVLSPSAAVQLARSSTASSNSGEAHGDAG